MCAQGCRNTRRVAWLMAITLMSFSSAFAANVETLLMPGKVSRAHIKQENDCANCHDRSNVKTQTSLCVDCHKPIAADLKQHQGYHGRMTNSGVGECKACHTEHNGRDATDDEHRGARGEDCGKCHVTKEWRTAKYDHLKETGYDLLGVHDRINCVACHRSGNYKDKIPKDCNGCHQADDAHAARFGQKCGDCHGNDHWPVKDYDHTGKHKFPLVGAHAKIDCYACHTAVAATQKLAKDCTGCHKSEDPHAGKLKDGCEACHGQQTWRSDIVFDHDLTDFPLKGLHRVVSCAQCHTTLAFSRAPATCDECHSHDDVHKGGLGKKCESCHSENGWQIWTFDHAKETHFPLLGAHKKLQCADCHHETPGTVKTLSQCGSCHNKDDRHLGQYGAQCDRCHSVDTWKGARIQ